MVRGLEFRAVAVVQCRINSLCLSFKSKSEFKSKKITAIYKSAAKIHIFRSSYVPKKNVTLPVVTKYIVIILT